MKVVFTDTFFESFKSNVIDAGKWYKFKFWQHKWWDLTRGIRNLRAYFKVVFNIHPYCSDQTIMSLTKISLERVLFWMERGLEVEENRLPKIKKIKRSIELINHFLEDDYMDRCGWISTGKLFEDGTPEEEERNSKAIKDSRVLQEKEWNELFTLLKEMRGWWD
jgi:hypothetical protein